MNHQYCSILRCLFLFLICFGCQSLSLFGSLYSFRFIHFKRCAKFRNEVIPSLNHTHLVVIFVWVPYICVLVWLTHSFTCRACFSVFRRATSFCFLWPDLLYGTKGKKNASIDEWFRHKCVTNWIRRISEISLNHWPNRNWNQWNDTYIFIATQWFLRNWIFLSAFLIVFILWTISALCLFLWHKKMCWAQCVYNVTFFPFCNWTLYQPITVTAFQNDFKTKWFPSRSRSLRPISISISILRFGGLFSALKYRFKCCHFNLYTCKVFVIHLLWIQVAGFVVWRSHLLSFCYGFVCNYLRVVVAFSSYKSLCNVYISSFMLRLQMPVFRCPANVYIVFFCHTMFVASAITWRRRRCRQWWWEKWTEQKKLK